MGTDFELLEKDFLFFEFESTAPRMTNKPFETPIYTTILEEEPRGTSRIQYILICKNLLQRSQKLLHKYQSMYEKQLSVTFFLIFWSSSGSSGD